MQRELGWLIRSYFGMPCTGCGAWVDEWICWRRDDVWLELTYGSTGRSDEWGDEIKTYYFFCSQCMRVNDPLSTDTEMELDSGSCSETTTTAGSRSSSETESEGRGSKRSRESAIATIAARMNARSLARSGGLARSLARSGGQ